MSREDHFQDITVAGKISIGANASFLNSSNISFSNIFTGKFNEIRTVTSDTFPTIQDALDDSGAEVVLVPANYTGAEETSIGDGQIIIDFRGGNFNIRADRTTSAAGEALIRVIEQSAGGNLTNDPFASDFVGIYSAVEAEAGRTDVWGINPLVQIPSGVAGTAVAVEANVNVRSTTAVLATGVNIVGASNTQPVGQARAVNIGVLGAGIKWTRGIDFQDGATDVGINLGTDETGNSQGSQHITFNSRDSGGTERTFIIQTGEDGQAVLGGTTNALQLDDDGTLKVRKGIGANGEGFKHTRIASGTTAASLHATASATWTFTTAFADTNYTITATIDNPTGVPIVAYTDNKATDSIDIVIIAGSATAASGTLNCTAIHD